MESNGHHVGCNARDLESSAAAARVCDCGWLVPFASGDFCTRDEKVAYDLLRFELNGRFLDVIKTFRETYPSLTLPQAYLRFLEEM